MIELTLHNMHARQEKARDTLLSTASPIEKHKAVQDLYSLYASITGITAATHTDTSLFLPCGVAISASAAAHCLLEFARTTVFLRGIHHAISDLKKKFPDERIRVLYAGCGPYASLITPLLTLYRSSDLVVDMIDITPRSIESVRHLHATLGLTDYVNNYLLCDATSYTVQGEQPVRLLISETLNAGLRNEPFLSIIQNLVPQLPEQSVLIPEKIAVDAVYLSLNAELQGFTTKDLQPQRFILGNLALVCKPDIRTPEPVTLTIPSINLAAYKLHLMTKVHVYKEALLKEYDCSLTLPMLVKLPGIAAGDHIRFSYWMNEKPGFVAERV